MSILDRTKIDYALETLDKSYNDIWTTKAGPQRESQFSYYNGQKRMLELITGYSINITFDGKHYIEEEGNVNSENNNAVSNDILTCVS